MNERRPGVRDLWAQLRIKITLPYALLAIFIAFATAYLVTNLLANLLQDRFHAALIDAGHKATDTVVQIEREQLAVWRTIAYTEGFAEAVAAGDGDGAALLALPLLANANLDALEILDSQGRPLNAQHHVPGGHALDYATGPGADYRQWQSVTRILTEQVDDIGDKYAELVNADWGWTFYIAGPIRHEGELVGVLLVGTYLDRIVQRLDNAALARVSIYLDEGRHILTTLAPQEISSLALDRPTYYTYLVEQETQIHRRDVTVAGREYAEAFGAFEARHWEEDMGLLSVALPLSFVTDANNPTRETMLWIFGTAIFLVLLTGALIANAVVQRIRQLATATHAVASGDLNTQVQVRGRDEISTLSQDFNRMVTQLREGQLYRDLLGLTTSPAIAAKLREEREKGHLDLRAQATIATIFFADIRGFTALSEGRDPAYIIAMLNEYLQGVVNIIQAHHGVINKFIGDAALAFFGVLPESHSPQESIENAVAAALEILQYLETLNRERELRGDIPIRLGIGINTGPVVAGLLGSESRFEYTVLGDAVNVAQRLSDLNKQYQDYDLFISEESCALLSADVRVTLTNLGDIQVKGRQHPVTVYALTQEQAR